MMQTKLALSLLAGAVVLGVATGAVAAAVGGDDTAGRDTPRASASPTPLPTAEEKKEETEPAAAAPTVESGGGDQGVPEAGAGLLPPSDLLITPGAVGPVRAGMTKAQALATGYFVADVPAPVDGCPVRPLTWRDEYVNTVDLQTAENGDVLSVGVRQPGPHTRSGFGVGTTWAQLRSVASDPQDAGYGQTGVFVRESNDASWIGFLFDTTPDQLADDDRVTFVEVTKGGQPGLVRDGC
ncbi:hypothetical protein [Aeromicrobium sp. Leaf245]|uniref:hypothetical protein n=1 Tax=Aeromicrobium sp. Leaf245 TaxID=1736306 RepID=UPI0006F1DED3|nr:hypothetical protein [Aeromicrobium sp. Leaf245]KQO36694.1 hypothetical protein ASF05_11225 [Aeromicrobium sp. Leaf245]